MEELGGSTTPGRSHCSSDSLLECLDFNFSHFKYLPLEFIICISDLHVIISLIFFPPRIEHTGLPRTFFGKD